eukprot:12730854-Alexandrium_andersonii.AAC.1
MIEASAVSGALASCRALCFTIAGMPASSLPAPCRSALLPSPCPCCCRQQQGRERPSRAACGESEQ